MTTTSTAPEDFAAMRAEAERIAYDQYNKKHRKFWAS